MPRAILAVAPAWIAGAAAIADRLAALALAS
jgi:hypothetical protein